MAYSRKGWWVAKTSSVLVVLAGEALVFWLRPTLAVAGVLLITAVLASFAFGMQAFFYRDEIERQTRMRCWYFGSMLGMISAAIVTISIFFFRLLNPQMITLFIFHMHRPPMPRDFFAAGFTTGLLLLIFAQILGALFFRVLFMLPARSRS